MTKKIVVIGSANTDLITRVKRIPKPGETVLGGTFMTAQGGKGANQAVAASRAGGDVTFIACLGNDAFSQKAIQSYNTDNIDVSRIIHNKNTPSGVALIFVAENGENSIAVASGAKNNLSPEIINKNKDIIDQAEIILLQLETPITTVEQAINTAHKKGVKLILNPAPAQKLPNSILEKIDVLTPNKLEAELITDIEINDLDTAQKAAQYLILTGVKNVIITLGEIGALVVNETINELVPCPDVTSVDSTAAGDTFNGALAVALTENKPLLEAVEFANAAAALSVTQQGAQPSIPTREGIELALNGKL